MLPVERRYDRGQRDYIQSCNLPQVSWVIPNGDASDHPGMATETYSTEIEHGPAWVAAIINAVGNSWDQSKVNGQNHQCDYWGTHGTGSKYQPTVIMVVWDDWGGWWDHVDPLSALPVRLPPYIHDFGSILAFIEYNWQLDQINQQYSFADHYAPELPSAIPLADFFCDAPCAAQPFLSIPVPVGAWQANDFFNDTDTSDPDDDAINND